MSTNKDQTWLCSGVSLLIAMLMVLQGCNKEGATNNDESNSQKQAIEEPAPGYTVPVAAGISPARQFESAMAGEKLVGVWFGGVHLDGEKVKAKLDRLEKPEVRQQFMAMAQTIESMRIATEFRADGTMEIDIEIQPIGGEPRRESTVGRWKIIEQDNYRVLIETTEPNNDPNQPEVKELVKQVQYTFIDKDHVAIPAPVSPDFYDCSPAVVFERQLTAGQPVERVTDQPGANIQK